MILHKIQGKNQNNLSTTGGGYKANLPKSILFLYISNNWLGKIRETSPLKQQRKVIGVVNLLKKTKKQKKPLKFNGEKFGWLQKRNIP